MTVRMMCLFASLVAGCALDDTALDEADQEVAVTGTWAWGTPGNNGADLDIGPDTTQTCFLSGVTGALVGASEIGDSTEASATVFRANGHYWVRTRAGYGYPGVEAHVTCIGATANRVEMSWAGDWHFPGHVPATPNRHCFLSGVYGRQGWAGTFNGQPTGVGIVLNGSNLEVTGYLTPQQDGETSPGGADAVCVDIASQVTSASHTAPANGWQQWPVVWNAIGNIDCGLTALSGPFLWSSPPFGWDDGVTIPYDSRSGWFDFKATSGKAGTVTCVK